MTKPTLSMSFESLDELLLFASAGKRALEGALGHADRPDVGAEPARPVVTLTPEPFNPFAALPPGGAGTPVVPFAAPSSAAVVPPPTAPAGLPPPPTASVPPAPSPAPVAPAPTVPAAPTNPAVVELDSNGMPWDHRIHSSTKAKIADGTWRQKRGTDPTIVAAVEAELRRTMSAPPVAPPPSAAGVPPAPAAPALTTFGDLMQAVEPGVSSGKISNLTIATILGEHQLANWFQLANRPDLVPTIAAKFAPHIAAATA